MELAFFILAGVSSVLSLAAFILSVWNTINIQAQKLSTHSVIPIAPDTTMGNIEKELEKIATGAGGNQTDLNRNLFSNGLDTDELV